MYFGSIFIAVMTNPRPITIIVGDKYKGIAFDSFKFGSARIIEHSPKKNPKKIKGETVLNSGGECLVRTTKIRTRILKHIGVYI